METYSEMQKASRNFFRSCMKFTVEEFVKEVREHHYVELTEYIEEMYGIHAGEQVRDDVITFVGGNRIYEVKVEDYVAAFDELNELEKTVLHSYYYAKASDRKIGEALGIPRSSIWDIRNNALKKMKRYLSEKEAY